MGIQNERERKRGRKKHALSKLRSARKVPSLGSPVMDGALTLIRYVTPG